MTTPLSPRSAGHLKRMAAARAARAANGLEETFGRQTDLRTQLEGMQRFLRYNETADIPDSLRDEIKERVQEVLANTAEELYLLTSTSHT